MGATKGKLELTKCFYYILQWKFDDEGVPSHTSKQELEEAGVTIAIQETGKDRPTEIKHINCNTAHRTLGVYKTISQETKVNNKSRQVKRVTQ